MHRCSVDAQALHAGVPAVASTPKLSCRTPQTGAFARQNAAEGVGPGVSPSVAHLDHHNDFGAAGDEVDLQRPLAQIARDNFVALCEQIRLDCALRSARELLTLFASDHTCTLGSERCWVASFSAGLSKYRWF
jgi:hypothetical protein